MVKSELIHDYEILIKIKKILLDLDHSILLAGAVTIPDPKYIKYQKEIVDWYIKLHTDIGTINTDYFDLGIKLLNGTVDNVAYNKNIKIIFINAINSYPDVLRTNTKESNQLRQKLAKHLERASIDDLYNCITEAIHRMLEYIFRIATV